MQYRKDRYGNEISMLGYGCMRFTQKAGKVDMKKTEHEIMAAIKHGINYFDTAYIYPGSEAALGQILDKNNCRDQVKIATKLPHYMIKSKKGMEKTFQEELKRLRTDHVDYYLMHMLTDVDTWKRLTDLGILEWLEEKKESGQIRQVGFSYHGNSDMFCRLIDVYDWDFTQIQYNYLDEHSQAGVKGLHYAAKKGIPVIIMEPLRGGKLVNKLPKDAVKAFEKSGRDWSPAEWAFRWLWNQPEVTCILSGMNSMEMLKENLRSANRAKVGEFGKKEFEVIEKAKKAINAKTKVGCTGCRYCMPCPKGVDIPGTFSAYNHIYTDGWAQGFLEYFMCTGLRQSSSAASACIECGKCEKHCPQNIAIRKELKNARKKLENPIYKIARKLIQIFHLY